ncbi:MAG TPA: S9 family peptidase [Thermoanaerobaculia bacterium]|jgi:dipeptidyl aminopeptidase/acylaminoacyl peptidase|nr:S9 family peptidase [Thermoanaerobaculia bacterium]
MKRLLLLLALAFPLLADDLERTVAMMAKVGFATAPSFSPDGKRIAFLTNISGVPQAWTIASSGGWPDQVTALDDPVSRVLWSPAGDWLALEVAPGGGLNTQVYVVRPDGTGLRRLTEGGKENNSLDAWTHDGKALLIDSNRRSADALDAWLVDVASGKMRLVAQTQGIGSINAVSRDDKYALLSRLANRGDDDIYRIALDGSSDVLITKHDPPATFGSSYFAGAKDDVVYLTGDPARDRSAFGRVTIKDGKASPLEVLAARDDAELGGFEIDDRGETALLAWNVGGRAELALFDLKTGKSRPLSRLPADILGAAAFSPDGKKIALALSGSAAPQDLWLLDVATGTLQQLTRSAHPGIDLAQLVRPELVQYTAADGLPLSGWLYRPKEAKPPYATVFSFHGGPESQERPTFNTQYQALVANGIAVFAPNVRGSAGFGKKFVNLDNGALRVGSVQDIKASVDALVSRNLADPKRLGIMGGSYGGYMVMAGVTEFPDLFAAGANLFGVVNFETFFAHSEPWMAVISKSEYGDPETQREMIRSISPVHKLDRVKTPLIVLHGANDTNVPVVEAEQVVNTLKARGVPVEYVLFPDEGHGWRKTANRIKSAVAVTRFFVEHLK